MARPDLHKGLFLRDSRHQTPNDLLPVQHRLSLPGKYSWIPVNILIIGYWPIVSQQKHARVGNSISVSMDCRSVRHVRFNGLETRIIVWTSFFLEKRREWDLLGSRENLVTSRCMIRKRGSPSLRYGRTSSHPFVQLGSITA